MTERGLDNVRIATKALIYFVVPLGLLFGVHTFVLVSPPQQPDFEVFPEEPSRIQTIGFAAYVILLFITFTLPLLVLRRELQKRRDRK